MAPEPGAAQAGALRQLGRQRAERNGRRSARSGEDRGRSCEHLAGLVRHARPVLGIARNVPAHRRGLAGGPHFRRTAGAAALLHRRQEARADSAQLHFQCVEIHHPRGSACLGTDGDPQQVRFAVTDTGIGIAPELHDRLFEDFAQVDSRCRSACAARVWDSPCANASPSCWAVGLACRASPARVRSST